MAEAKTGDKPIELAKPPAGELGERVQQRVSALVGKPWFWVLGITFLFVVVLGSALRRHVPPPLPKLFAPLPAFTLTNERGQPFGTEDLKGRIWVANFIFTSCGGPCPKLSKRMFEIQHRTRNMGDSLRLVTFSVDPENDTPEVLAAYSKRYRANPRKWTFLTGPLGDVEALAVKGFKEATGKEGLFAIGHSEHLFLIDPTGQIRGFYEATDEGVAALLHDMGILANVP